MQVEVISDGKKVSELLTLSEIEEYDSKGVLIHRKSIGDEAEYDKNGNIVLLKYGDSVYEQNEYDEYGRLTYHYIGDDGPQKFWHEYDENGNEICRFLWNILSFSGVAVLYSAEYDTSGKLLRKRGRDYGMVWPNIGEHYVYDTVYEYNANGILIREKTDGKAATDWLCDFDSDGNLILPKDSREFESLTEYDENGNVLHSKDGFRGYEKWYDANGKQIYPDSEYEYDENGNILHSMDEEGHEELYEYDLKGNLLYAKDTYPNYESYGYRNPREDYEEWNSYDKNGNIIHSKSIEEFDDTSRKETECWYKYDENGKLIYSKDSNGSESWHKYDENGTLRYSKKTDGNSYATQ